MKRPGLMLYGATAYILFNLSFLYMLGFLHGVPGVKGINDGPEIAAPLAVTINIGLIFLFGFFHSLMARSAFKRWWTQVIPVEAERSIYVMQSAVFLGFALWHWQPMPTILWLFDGPVALAFYVIFGVGVVALLWSTFLIDHFELFGLRQIWSANTQQSMPKPVFRTPSLYRLVRHPMQLGMILVLFGTPHMTVGHLLFAASMTLYIVIGLWFEERALRREFGQVYLAYQSAVPMLIPGMKRGAKQSAKLRGN